MELISCFTIIILGVVAISSVSGRLFYTSVMAFIFRVKKLFAFYVKGCATADSKISYSVVYLLLLFEREA